MPATKNNNHTILGKARGHLKDAIEISVTAERMRTPARATATLEEAIRAAETGVEKMREQLQELERRHGAGES
jgi:hypothetical protein